MDKFNKRYLGNIIYEADAYSGSQIAIYIGDIFIDMATSISVSTQQSKTPVFGYANQYYTFIADGHNIVEGTLSIIFKETGYLLHPVKRYLERLNKDPMSITNANHTYVSRANVEESLVMNPRDKNKFYQDLAALSDNDFEDWAEAFENYIWKNSDKTNPFARDNLFSKNIREGEEITKESLYSHRRLDQYLPIDIWISYGDLEYENSNHTSKKLLDVSFLGQSQIIETSGQPIIESYTFVARNFV